MGGMIALGLRAISMRDSGAAMIGVSVRWDGCTAAGSSWLDMDGAVCAESLELAALMVLTLSFIDATGTPLMYSLGPSWSIHFRDGAERSIIKQKKLRGRSNLRCIQWGLCSLKHKKLVIYWRLAQQHGQLGSTITTDKWNWFPHRIRLIFDDIKFHAEARKLQDKRKKKKKKHWAWLSEEGSQNQEPYTHGAHNCHNKKLKIMYEMEASEYLMNIYTNTVIHQWSQLSRFQSVCSLHLRFHHNSRNGISSLIFQISYSRNPEFSEFENSSAQ